MARPTAVSAAREHSLLNMGRRPGSSPPALWQCRGGNCAGQAGCAQGAAAHSGSAGTCGSRVVTSAGFSERRACKAQAVLKAASAVAVWERTGW